MIPPSLFLAFFIHLYRPTHSLNFPPPSPSLVTGESDHDTTNLGLRATLLRKEVGHFAPPLFLGKEIFLKTQGLFSTQSVAQVLMPFYC